MSLMIFAPNYQTFMVGQVLSGFFACGMGQYTLPMELVSASNRFIVGVLMTTGWASGMAWYLLSSFIFRDWRYAAFMTFV